MSSTSRRPVPAARHLFVLLAAGLAVAPLVGASPALAQPKGAAAAAAPSKKALDLFKKGQALFNKNNFADALPLFRESYALVASPNSQIYIARCLAGTGDNVGAYLEFTALIADVDARKDPKYDPARENATKEREEAAGKIALLTVTVENSGSETRLSVGGRDIPREKWGQPIPVAPGGIDVGVTTPPGPLQSQHLDLRAGEKRPLALNAAGAAGAGTGTVAPPTTSTPAGSRAFLRPAAYAAAGVGVAGFVVFAITGALSTSAYADLDKKCGPVDPTTKQRACPSDLKSAIDNGKVEQTLANVSLIVGAVGIAAGATLFVLSLSGAPKKDEAPKTSLVIGPSYLGVQGSF